MDRCDAEWIAGLGPRGCIAVLRLSQLEVQR